MPNKVNVKPLGDRKDVKKLPSGASTWPSSSNPVDRSRPTSTHYNTQPIRETSGHSTSSSQDERERYYHNAINEAIAAGMPQGIEADAKRWNDEHNSEWCRNYSNPDEIKSEFPKLDSRVNDELLSLEQQLREIVEYGQAPELMIRFEDAKGVCARNDKWTSARIDNMSNGTRKLELNTARAKIQVLREQLQSLQRLVYERCIGINEGRIYAPYVYKSKPRPVAAG